MSGRATPPEMRKKWSDRFAHQVRLLDKNAGLLSTTCESSTGSSPNGATIA
jgi:hypothetical protein